MMRLSRVSSYQHNNLPPFFLVDFTLKPAILTGRIKFISISDVFGHLSNYLNYLLAELSITTWLCYDRPQKLPCNKRYNKLFLFFLFGYIARPIQACFRPMVPLPARRRRRACQCPRLRAGEVPAPFGSRPLYRPAPPRPGHPSRARRPGVRYIYSRKNRSLLQRANSKINPTADLSAPWTSPVRVFKSIWRGRILWTASRWRRYPLGHPVQRHGCN